MIGLHWAKILFLGSSNRGLNCLSIGCTYTFVRIKTDTKIDIVKA